MMSREHRENRRRAITVDRVRRVGERVRKAARIGVNGPAWFVTGVKYKLGLGPSERDALDPKLVCLFRRGKKRYYRWKSWLLTGRRYETSTDPFRLHSIDPARIGSVLVDDSIHEHGGITSEVIGGEWERHTVPFEELDVYRAIRDRFENGVDWTETAFYHRVRREIRSGAVKWGCETVEEFDDRCEAIDSLYESIAKNGYVPQDELWERYCTSDRSGGIEGPPSNYEVIVDIDRDGEYLLVDGRHRLSIARLLEMDRIPVQVKARHQRWQGKRERAKDGAAISGDHPDLCDGRPARERRHLVS